MIDTTLLRTCAGERKSHVAWPASCRALTHYGLCCGHLPFAMRRTRQTTGNARRLSQQLDVSPYTVHPAEVHPTAGVAAPRTVRRRSRGAGVRRRPASARVRSRPAANPTPQATVRTVEAPTRAEVGRVRPRSAKPALHRSDTASQLRQHILKRAPTAPHGSIAAALGDGAPARPREVLVWHRGNIDARKWAVFGARKRPHSAPRARGMTAGSRSDRPPPVQGLRARRRRPESAGAQQQQQQQQPQQQQRGLMLATVIGPQPVVNVWGGANAGTGGNSNGFGNPAATSSDGGTQRGATACMGVPGGPTPGARLTEALATYRSTTGHTTYATAAATAQPTVSPLARANTAAVLRPAACTPQRGSITARGTESRERGWHSALLAAKLASGNGIAANARGRLRRGFKHHLQSAQRALEEAKVQPRDATVVVGTSRPSSSTQVSERDVRRETGLATVALLCLAQPKSLPTVTTSSTVGSAVAVCGGQRPGGRG